MTSTTIDARQKKSHQEDFDNSVEVANVLANVAAVVLADAPPGPGPLPRRLQVLHPH